MIEDEKLPFTSHLEELRKRLITVFIAVGVGFVASFGFKEYLFKILVQPLINVMKEGETLIYTGLPEAFFTYLKVAFLTGLIVASPTWGFKFFMGFATETIRPLPSMKEYFGFSAKLLLAFGLVFELPLVLTFMAKLGLVSVDFLKKNRKYALLLFFAGAAILTPPDVITQILMALPLMVLYEISIIGAKIFGKKKPKEETAAKETGKDTA
jgi:sec-independent protein translocase protein TatC